MTVICRLGCGRGTPPSTGIAEVAAALALSAEGAAGDDPGAVSEGTAVESTGIGVEGLPVRVKGEALLSRLIGKGDALSGKVNRRVGVCGRSDTGAAGAESSAPLRAFRAPSG